ncbi:hypothetical protein VPH35_137468 [Triticum aestivum]
MRRRTDGSTLLLHLPTNALGPSCCSPPPAYASTKHGIRCSPHRSTVAGQLLAAKSPRSIEPEMALYAAAAGHLDQTPPGPSSLSTRLHFFHPCSNLTSISLHPSFLSNKQ